jgi:hypothetical protein
MTKADAVATTLREAVRLCLEAAGNSRDPSFPMERSWEKAPPRKGSHL